MVVLAYCLGAMLQIVVPVGGGDETGQGASLFGHIVSLIFTVAGTFLIGAGIFAIGRLFGGVATREQSIVAACWHQLVMTLMLPVLFVAVGGSALRLDAEKPETMSLAAFLAIVLYAVQFVWLLARYTTTIHRFRSEWPVIGVILGTLLLISSLFVLARGG